MIGFAGLSHLGILSSIASASKGFDVIAYDPNVDLCSDLNAGKLPIFEPDLDDLLKNNKSHIRFSSSEADLNKCQLIVFSADVKTDENNRSDLSNLIELIDRVVEIAADDTILVILSQVHPGFTRQLNFKLGPVLETKKISLFYQVETLVFGRAVERALYPERFIVGCNNPADPIPGVYHEFLNSFGCPILPMKYESAELAKISINCCLVASVSTANTLAEISEKIGADWSEIVPALKLDKRIGQYSYLEPGLGIAGGNLERDLMTITNIAREFGTDAGVVESWVANSAYRKEWVFRNLHTLVLSKYTAPTVAVWGLAYKINTKSIKNSPSLVLLNNIKGVNVKAYDPQALIDPGVFPLVKQIHSPLEACLGAHALVIMTPWAEFNSIDLLELKNHLAGNIIIDPYKILNGELCREMGFVYLTLGRAMETVND
jgi:UDPglucose 6-dehydrogenase